VIHHSESGFKIKGKILNRYHSVLNRDRIQMYGKILITMVKGNRKFVEYAVKMKVSNLTCLV